MFDLPLGMQDVLSSHGSNPFSALLYILQHGGLVIIWIVFVFLCIEGWLFWIQEKTKHHRKYILMSVNVPKDNEQSMKAVEQIYTQIYGTIRVPTFKEKWWDGWTQPLFAFEIASTEGYLQFYIRCYLPHQDIVEAAIYAQYPDAEIRTVPKAEDYTNALNVKMIEDGTHDLYGAELREAIEDIWSIRNWRNWEHSLVGKFIDPLSATLEIMSRIGPGEHFWFQILAEPEQPDHLYHRCKEAIEKIIGEHKEHESILDKIIEVPIKIFEAFSDAIFSNGEGSSHEEKEAKRIFLVEYEREAVTELDMKRSRWPFLSKVRFIYWGKKEVFNAEKARRGFMGAMMQFTFLSNYFIEGRYTKCELKDTYFWDMYYQPLKKLRLFWRKRRLIWNYKAMDMERGEIMGFALSVEELTSLYHFPQMMVRAPFVQKAEAKRFEPPTYLTYEKAGIPGAQPVEIRMEKMTEEIPHAGTIYVNPKPSIIEPTTAADDKGPPPNLPIV